jgi:hypothetical protein
LTGGQPLQWFPGIEVIRDRKRRLIWLSQSDYLDKIANLADMRSESPMHPMKKEELLPYQGRATAALINKYQRKVGSILYAAVITRLDIAFAASHLSRFNMNPGPEHHRAADQVLNYYLLGSKALVLQPGGEDSFFVSSDASFADNTLDLKSSHTYVMKSSLVELSADERTNRQLCQHQRRQSYLPYLKQRRNLSLCLGC